jgi:hypothetical protein
VFFFVSRVEAVGGQGGNAGVRLYLLLVYGSVIFGEPSGSRMGSGRECWGGSVTVISIQLCVLLSAEWN